MYLTFLPSSQIARLLYTLLRRPKNKEGPLHHHLTKVTSVHLSLWRGSVFLSLSLPLHIGVPFWSPSNGLLPSYLQSFCFVSSKRRQSLRFPLKNLFSFKKTNRLISMFSNILTLILTNFSTNLHSLFM